MEELKFNVYKNCLTITDPFKPHIHPAADTVKYLKGAFTFDSTWDGFEKRVYFKNASYNIVKSVLLGDSNICYVPWEVLAHTGVIRCNIVGLKYSDDIVTQRITTNPVVFEILVDESILEPYDQQPLTPTEYEQFRILFNGVYESTVEAKDEAIDAKDDVLEAISTLDIPLEQAQEYAETSEAYAVGTRSGDPVESDDPTYDNNARYYSQRSFEYMESASIAKEDAEDAKEDANSSKLDAAASANSSLLFAYDSEAYAVGKRGGTDVEYSDITFENNSKYYKEAAAVYSTNARDFSLKSEGFSVGEQNGQPVSSGSPYYHNNAKYYYEHMDDVKNVWYGICETDLTTNRKVVTTMSGDFRGDEGDIIVVEFSEGINGVDTISLVIDGTQYPTLGPSPYFREGDEYAATTILTFVISGGCAGMIDNYVGLYAEYLNSVKQDKLISGTNIKTINNTSLLGSGNIDIQGGGASAFIAEYGVTSYSDVKDAYDEDAIILCKSDDSGNTAILQLAYFDDANDGFIFTEPTDDGWRWTSIVSNDTWDDGSFQFATTDTATQLRDGLMSSLDWQKLDGIASGAEVNVQSDWSQSDNTADDYIKNKPTIPTVNNATLTIQMNGTTINTFTANASSDVTVNITMPNIFVSTSDPTSADGENGDVWFKYSV